MDASDPLINSRYSSEHTIVTVWHTIVTVWTTDKHTLRGSIQVRTNNRTNIIFTDLLIKSCVEVLVGAVL